LELIPVSHVDEVLFEALRCRTPQDFAAYLQKKQVKDELLYSEEKKKDEGAGGEGRDEKAPATGIVAH
jgi:hypothetical protein